MNHHDVLAVLLCSVLLYLVVDLKARVPTFVVVSNIIPVQHFTTFS
jgi:hypothetical protein